MDTDCVKETIVWKIHNPWYLEVRNINKWLFLPSVWRKLIYFGLDDELKNGNLNSANCQRWICEPDGCIHDKDEIEEGKTEGDVEESRREAFSERLYFSTKWVGLSNNLEIWN